MDDQEKQDDQRELLLKIARCEIANERLNLLIREKGKIDLESHDCNAVCKFQYDKNQDENDSEQKFTKAMFHMPEPWNGNLKTAKILFVSSNPSIDLKENFPKFESEEWSDDEVVKFFGKRLESYKNRYWTGILKYAEYILKKTDPSRALDKKKEEEKKAIASCIALTEIVHCKSRGETGVKKAAKTCFDIHTNEVIVEFLKTPSDPGNNKIVVFVGGKARDLIYALAKKGGFKIEGESISSFYESKFGEHSKDARFLFVPHPNARQWKSRKSGELYKKLPNGIRQTIIDEELEQHG